MEEQLKASITSAAPDTNTLILNILKCTLTSAFKAITDFQLRQPESHAVAAAVNDYISMFTGTYGAPTEKSGKSVPRVVEEITSVLGMIAFRFLFVAIL